MLVDERTIEVRAGKGGNGVVNWRREKYIDKGGPDGGDGGPGGDIYIKAIRSITALNRYKNDELYEAENGEDGKGKKKTGKRGKDLILNVPVGSVILNKDTGERFELVKEGEKVFVAAGGKGGLGNTRFKGPTNTTPKTATKGVKGQSYTLFIELNIIADVGLVGLPNAGKTTLLNSITRANAKVGDYPFTTLEPNLGVMYGYVFADIPGVIEGASSGKGLGHKFLKHIKRTKMILHLVSLENEDLKKSYESIRKEFIEYSDNLGDKKEIIVLTKKDLVDEEKIDLAKKQFDKEVFVISSLDEASIDLLVSQLSKELNSI